MGTDGSGKSTVANALLAWMQSQRPTELHHLGKQTGHIGRAIARMSGMEFLDTDTEIERESGMAIVIVQVLGTARSSENSVQAPNSLLTDSVPPWRCGR